MQPALEQSPPIAVGMPRAAVRHVRVGKRLRRWLAARSIAFAARVLPTLYMAYMWLVRVTSRHDDVLLTPLLRGAVERHDRAIAALWHQEVFSVAYNYRHLHGHTLASVSDFGAVITGMLRRCNFVVFRGGSGSSSRRRNVLATMIAHMRRTPRVIYGLTVDGSQGPVYRVKPGCVAIARACRAPIVLVRTCYRRAFALPTWDRAQIPIPFTRRVTLATGPYWIAPDADEGACEAFRLHLERELLELTSRAHAHLGTPRARWRNFPAAWTSEWAPDQLGSAFGAHDLDADHPPPWAHRRASAPAAAAG
jgi:lysophospholipid acyltransferase (LPLAT)-like uncharacterized protein